jgi:SAM-dependent methyltransferase
MDQKPMLSEKRTIAQLRNHYEIEKDLANKLRNASPEERCFLYSSLYDELYKRVPLLPQLTIKASPHESEEFVSRQMNFLKPFLDKDKTFLEIGPGDCGVSFETAKFVQQVYAVDVSNEITKSLTQPPNFHLIISNGNSVALPPHSVNIAYSNHVIEHLHPDDAIKQLKNIYNTLVSGGVYICITPNRLTGPHDISKYFDKVASGFHLKEYTTFELCSLFKKVGFARARVFIKIKGKFISIPRVISIFLEKLIEKLPHESRKVLARILPFRLLLDDIRIIGIK